MPYLSINCNHDVFVYIELDDDITTHDKEQRNFNKGLEKLKNNERDISEKISTDTKVNLTLLTAATEQQFLL